jgi:predicted Fe-Mo cluster-binding NifX family protein
MRLIVSANGSGLDASFSPLFGRCSQFVAVDSVTLECEDVPNEAMNAAGGAGIQAAQLVVSSGADAVITGQIGPNAQRVLEATGVPVLLFVGGGTVRDAVVAHNANTLIRASAATVPARGGNAGPHGWAHGHGAGRMNQVTRPAGAAPVANRDKAPTESAEPDTVTALRAEIADLNARLGDLSQQVETLHQKTVGR